MPGLPKITGAQAILGRAAAAAFLITVLMVSGPVAAQTYYLGFSGGYTKAVDTDLTLNGSPLSAAAFEPGGAAAAVFGFESHDGWRVEGELSWRKTSLDTLDGVDADGTFETWATMVNVFYRPNNRAAAGLYLGGGVGAVRVEAIRVSTASPLEDFDLAPAWQIGAGVEYAMFRRTTLSIDYRYLVANQIDLVDDSGGRVEMDSRSNNVMIGLRFGF